MFLLCPLAMVAMLGWWAWSMRRTSVGSSDRGGAAARSTTEDAELARLRAHVDQLEAQSRDLPVQQRG